MLLKIIFKEEAHVMKLKQNHKYNDLQEYIVKAFKKLPEKYYIVYVDEDGDQVSLDNEHDFVGLVETRSTKTNIKIIETNSQDLMQIQRIQLKQEEQSSVDLIKIDISNIKEVIEQKQENIENLSYSTNKQPQIKQQFLQKLIPKKQNFIEEIKQKPQQQLKEIEQINKKHNFVHQDIKCDICGVDPIIGIRYKCSVCIDYDLCESCQQIYEHDHHALIRIKYSGQQYQRIGKSAVQVISRSVAGGANIIKNGFCSAVGILKKKSQQSNKKQIQNDCEDYKIQENKKVQKKHKPQDNIYAALDKIKPNKIQVEAEVSPQPKQKTEEDRAIDSANYLHTILGFDFSRCYAFVKKYPSLSDQQLIVQYFSDIKSI